MSDNSLYAVMWFSAVVMMVSVVVGITNYNISQDRFVVDMVKAGASATEAGCALGTSYPKGSACLVAVKNK